VQAVNAGERCFTRTTETASVADLDGRNIDWVGVLPPEWRLLAGTCAALVEAGYCPPCEPPPADCCVINTRWPCRLYAQPPRQYQAYETPESRCCVLGNFHRVRVRERATFVVWGFTGNQSVNTFCNPFFFDFFNPIEQQESTRTIDVATVDDCGRVRGYEGTFTLSNQTRRYRNDGFAVDGDRIVPINPRFETTETSSSGQTATADPFYPGLLQFIPGGFYGLYLPEREPTPNAPPLLSICDGAVSIEQDLNFDGIADNIGNWFVRGNIQCTGAAITYGYDVSELVCIGDDGVPRYLYTRMRWSFDWEVYDVDRSTCQARECSELGRPGPRDGLIFPPDFKSPGAFPTCRSCREQPGL
jgi:hypothetical protein